MKHFILSLVYLFSVNSFSASAKLMSCKSQRFNPYFYFEVVQKDKTNIYDTVGKLDKAINGIAGEMRNRLWKDYLDFSVDSYNCKLEVYSSKKSLDEFSVYLKLDDLKGENLTGIITGSLLKHDQEIRCQIINKDFFKSIKSTCI